MARKNAVHPALHDLIKEVMEQHDIPTRKDFANLMGKMAQLENLMKQVQIVTDMGGSRKGAGRRGKRSGLSASDVVLSVLRDHGSDMEFKEIRQKTGYDDKKLRNIVFRLFKTGKIFREGRGTYRIIPEAQEEIAEK